MNEDTAFKCETTHLVSACTPPRLFLQIILQQTHLTLKNLWLKTMVCKSKPTQGI